MLFNIRTLWNVENEKDHRINSVFGSTMGGLAMRALTIQSKSVLTQSNFGKNPKELDGKAIKRKADQCLRHCKKYVAYWKEFLINDQFPSGKDEDDALKHVVSRVYNDSRGHTGEIDNDEEESSDSDDEVDGAAPEKYSTSELALVPPDKFYPTDFLAFMLMGPWGKAKHDLDICPLLSADVKDLDGLKDVGRQNMRKEDIKVQDLTREGSVGRGLTTLQIAELNQKNRALQVDEDIMKQQSRVQKDSNRKNRFEMYEKLIELGPTKIGQSRYDICVDKMFGLLEQLDQDSDEDSRYPKKKRSKSSSSSESPTPCEDSFTE